MLRRSGQLQWSHSMQSWAGWTQGRCGLTMNMVWNPKWDSCLPPARTSEPPWLPRMRGYLRWVRSLEPVWLEVWGMSSGHKRKMRRWLGGCASPGWLPTQCLLCPYCLNPETPQTPLQLEVAMWPNSGWWDGGRNLLEVDKKGPAQLACLWRMLSFLLLEQKTWGPQGNSPLITTRW